jgi:hypothetical protein
MTRGCDSFGGVTDFGPSEALNPAQVEVLEQLGAAAGERPTFPDELRTDLRVAIEAELDPILPENDDLFVNKHALSQVHGCEAKYLDEQENRHFEWTVPTARGTVAHKAIELGVNWDGEPLPTELVDRATARLENSEAGISQWIQGLDLAEQAELRSDAVDRVTKFFECWPPLNPKWRPVAESRVRAELCGGRLILQGKVDLTLGRAQGLTAGKVLVDLKTGGFSPYHLDDLRFYALVETLRIGTPPRRLASYYLDEGSFVAEDVSEALIESTVARLIDGALKMVELRQHDRAPSKLPGPPCRWCQILDDCDEGRSHLEEDGF